MIKIRYFGFLKDILQIEEEEITWDNGNSQDLLNFLRSRNASWSDALAEENIFRLAINQRIIYQPTPLHPDDEVAILPPVTGG
ncbi:MULTISPECIES: MoaD/ThiS family protein [Commensalibacter]|uniref:Molybdopterin synthase sulfur carrier subunit n=1 Tax=Commensalibacter melissae TaxID=2070537 RepID=A0A318MY12_9PROT|nr:MULTISPECIES: MoaD/ThiS family protein [Commensalibacter]AYN87542.1 MoaD/ThiS family protein [Commensalibacter melissae]MBH9973549.1 MoaD/ThiS family protein [Commensalibacter melissae]MBI0017303.1 MoaD/ThiS family protein [Commensalibacter sp. B14384M2]MBI0018975.1 MoaD/ThiS family protein [Commensalibacter sp. W8133]MBI0049401.1 MoaD/ThiS family protein [Commensalibacter sp. B14384M3]